METLHCMYIPLPKVNVSEELSSVETVQPQVNTLGCTPKRCLGPDIKSIKGWLKRRELAIKVLAYNIERMLYKKRAKDLGIPLG